MSLIARRYRLLLGLLGLVSLATNLVIVHGSYDLASYGPYPGFWQFMGHNVTAWLPAGAWLLAGILLPLAVLRRRSVGSWYISAALLLGFLGYFFVFDQFGPEPAFMPNQIRVVDENGPPVTITLNDQPVANLVCDSRGGTSTITLAASDRRLPAMPWHLAVLRGDGQLINAFTFDHLDPWVLLIRGQDSAFLIGANAPSWGLPGTPSAECPDGGLQH